MMHDELKSQYQKASQEQSPVSIDEQILAEARTAVADDSKPYILRRGWKPVLATAASVTLVVSLAFQMVPEHERQWSGDIPTTPMLDTETTSRSIQPTVSEKMIASEASGSESVAELEIGLTSLDPQPASAFADSTEHDSDQTSPEPKINTAKAKKNVVSMAHGAADKARQIRISEAKKQRKEEQKRLLALQQSPATVLSDTELKERLNKILLLLQQGDKEQAQLAWLKLQDHVSEIPKSEAIETLWQKVANSFE